MAARLQIMERLHKVDDQLDVYYRSMANSYQCVEAELSALLRDIEEQAARNVKAVAPKSRKKLKPKVKQEKRSSGPARRSSLRRTTQASASLTKKSSGPRKVKMEPVSPPSSDTDMGQENVDPRGGASDQTETAAVETITPVQAATPVAQTPSRLQGTPLMTRSQTRQLQNAQGNAQHTVPDSSKTPLSAVPKAMRALQLGSPAKHTPTRARQLFSPYAKCSVQEKARAFEQKLVKHVQPVPTPSKGTPSRATPKATAVPTPVATPSTITRKALKRKSSFAEKRIMRSSTASQLEENEKQTAQDLSSTLTSGGEDDSDWQDSPAVKKFALPPSRPKVARGDPGAKAGKATSSKVLAVSKPGIPSIQLVRPSTSEPGTSRKRLHSKSPDVARKRTPSNSSDSEQQRKQGLLKMKTEAMKRDHEKKLAQVNAARQQREARKLEADRLRALKEQEKEEERRKKRAAFHQRKQSDRSLDVATLAATHKRKAESPAMSLRPKFLSPAPKNPRNHGKQDADAAMLVFGQPNTSLSQKAKLNNSLQQQAMLNSLSKSFKSQASSVEGDSAPKAPVGAPAGESKPNAAADSTFTMNSTFTVEAVCPDTPVQSNSTRPKSAATSYDITPHRSELPPAPNKHPDNYDIEDLDSGDETDDDSEPHKEVPAWATSVPLFRMVTAQHRARPAGSRMFGQIENLNLDNVFSVSKKYFHKRTSSAIWATKGH
ncbi:inner centromere protein-like isoform X3 [Ixodes scapularis]|uniref:inner centromere protein-like isoform X3 n=1 Tax=Ixodes scapularis TaxID=6945 RepID=UPI001AD63DFF|nr:inner centromere protein-like isoform X3 [Ixodes scapularis]